MPIPYFALLSSRRHVLACSELSDDFGHKIYALDFLNSHAKAGQYAASANGFKKLFERYANGEKIPSDLFHEADKNEKIWEFIKGDLRVFCFFDEDKVVLTHGIVKKGQKADSQEVARAIRMKKAYFEK